MGELAGLHACIVAESTVPQPSAPPAPEKDGPCQAWGCPRTGTRRDDDVLCAFHAGTDTPRTRHRPHPTKGPTP